MPRSATGSRRSTMSDPVTGLLVAVALGANHFYTLLRPEKF
jgi:K+-transporting ATPase KdpF subunit